MSRFVPSVSFRFPVIIPCILFIAFSAGMGAAPVRAQSGAAQNLTVERIYSAPSLSGQLTPGIEWSPDGKRISYLDLNQPGGIELWTMDAVTGQRRMLVDSETLEAVMQPERARAVQSTGLGRVQPENYLWSPAGDSL